MFTRTEDGKVRIRITYDVVYEGDVVSVASQLGSMVRALSDGPALIDENIVTIHAPPNIGEKLVRRKTEDMYYTMNRIILGEK